jgi:hypothetical protein
MKKGMWAGKILMMAVAGISFLFVMIVATQYLWNWLVPELFAGPVITFWQTAGLLVLSKIFLWTFGRRGSHTGGPWKYYWKEKWADMSPEERDRLKQKMKEKWCYREDAPTREPGSSNG